MSEGTASIDAIVIERVFDAPVEVVWQMWTQPEHFKGWYGPDGVSVPVAEMDVRVGGRHLICMEMQTPDGPMKMWTTGEYTEVVPNQRLVYTDSPSDERGNVVSTYGEAKGGEHPTTTEVTVELEDLGGRTRMVMTHAGMAPDTGAGQAWKQAFDKMTDRIEALLEDK
jgi:uncharacterized protein YndB with AHSA1/START domain